MTKIHVFCTAVRTVSIRAVCSLLALTWPVYKRHVNKTQIYDVTDNPHLNHNKT